MSKDRFSGRTVSTRDVHRIIKDREIRFVDLKFPDLFGGLQHFTLPIEVFDDAVFLDGAGFDGSSVRGFQEIHESDMLIKPDPATMYVEPFMDEPTLSFMCNITDPLTHKTYSRDTRAVAQRAERFLEREGIADATFFGPELEFFLFDEVRFGQTINEGFYHVDSEEGAWNSGRAEGPNLGYKTPMKGGYWSVPPLDTSHNLRSKMVSILRSVGVDAEMHHHEVGTGGQSEITLRFNRLVPMADQALLMKYVVKNVARRYGKTATFMPKPLFQDNGSGNHVHCSVWKDGRNLFYQRGRYAELSDFAVHFIGGLLHHTPALCALVAPTTNSYRRLVPGFEAPVNLFYSQRNRSACIRIPLYSQSEKAKRLEFRIPDPTNNPYLAYPAILMAGIDGVIRKLDPPDPIDEDVYELARSENPPKIGSAPSSLEGALDALEADHEFLLRGGVFTKDLVEMYVDYKRRNEVDHIRMRPHPAEFDLYYNC